MKEILLTGNLSNGKKAIVDDDAYDWLMQWKWMYNGRYAVRRINNFGKGKHFRMHREIIQAPSGVEVDHINGNGIDNRRENLRLCTHAENMKNMKTPITNTSGYKGVSWKKEKKKWVAQLRINGRQVYLGYFDTAEAASMAYNKAAVEHNGEFANINQGKVKL